MALAESATRDERQENHSFPLESFPDHFFFFSSLNDPPTLVARGCSFSVICHFPSMGPLGMGVRIRIIIDHELNDA